MRYGAADQQQHESSRAGRADRGVRETDEQPCSAGEFEQADEAELRDGETQVLGVGPHDGKREHLGAAGEDEQRSQDDGQDSAHNASNDSIYWRRRYKTI